MPIFVLEDEQSHTSFRLEQYLDGDIAVVANGVSLGYFCSAGGQFYRYRLSSYQRAKLRDLSFDGDKIEML